MTGTQIVPGERAIALLGGEANDANLRRYLHGIPGVDAVGLEQRAAGLGTRSIKTTSKAWALDRIIGLIDLTTLEGADTPGKVRSLVAKAVTPDAADPSCPRVAAVCVYGDMVPHAVQALGTAHGDPDQGKIAVAAVATAFPSGRASWLGILAGGDFIKTSTGKVAPAATLPVTLLMLEVVRDWHRLSGEKVGVKPAGGIRASKDAIKYLVTVAETVGEEWLTPHLFRFGASSLLNDVLLQRQKMTTGHYAGPDYVTID